MREFLRYLFVVAAMLMVVVGDVWAWRGAKIELESNPEEGGYVYANNSNSGPSSYNLTYDYAENSNNKVVAYTFTFYRFYQTNPGYVFKGWSESAANNAGDEGGSCGISGNLTNYNTKKYYAIFATLQNTTGKPVFDDTYVGQTNTKKIVIKHAHAADVKLELSGDHKGDFSVMTSSFTSTTAGNKEIEIKFSPKCGGPRKAKLTITSTNGLQPVEVELEGNGLLNPASISWDNEPINTIMYVGEVREISATATVQNNVSYSSLDNSIISIQGNVLTANSAGTVTIKATQSADCKYEEVVITKEFTVTAMKTPNFWLNNDPDMMEEDIMVDDVRTITVSNIDGMYAFYDSEQLDYKFEGNVVTIKALCGGKATLRLYQPLKDGEIYEGERTFTFNIGKYNSDFQLKLDEEFSCYVDQSCTETEMYSKNLNNTLPVIIESSDENVVEFKNGVLSAVGAGTAVVTMRQEEDCKWTDFKKSYTIHVNKYDMSASLETTEAWCNELIEGAVIVPYGLQNYTVESMRPAIAKYLDGNKIQTYFTEGIAQFRVTRDEDRKYKKLDVTLDLNVKKNTEGCLVLDAKDEVSLEYSIFWQEKIYEPASFTGIPDELTFYAYKSNGTAVGNIEVQQYVNSNWIPVKDNSGNNVDIDASTSYQKYGPFTLDKSATKVRFFNGYGSYKRYFKDVKVTRKTDLTLDVNEDVFYLTQSSDNMDFEGEFDLNWSTCDDKISLVCDNPLFTITPSVIDATTIKNGSTRIRITCNTTDAASLTGELTIFDQEQKKSLTLSCEYLRQWIVWGQYFNNLEADENGNITFISDALNAYAADVNGVPTGTPVEYTLDADAEKIANLETIDGKLCLRIFGVGDGHIIASVPSAVIDGVPHSADAVSHAIRVRREGEPCKFEVMLSERVELNIIDESQWFDVRELNASALKYVAHRDLLGTNYFYVQFSSDNTQSVTEIYQDLKGNEDAEYIHTLPEGTTHLRFVTKTGATGRKYIKNIRMSMKTYLTPDIEQINETIYVNQDFSRVINVAYSDIPLIQNELTQNTTDKLRLTPNQKINNNCGLKEFGSYAYTLTGRWINPQVVTETLHYYTSAGNDQYIQINIVVIEGDEYVTVQNGEWTDPSTWNKNTIPQSYNRTTIKHEVTISEDANAYGVNMQGGKMHITNTGGLTIFAVGYTTTCTEEDITIDVDKVGAGYLRISPEFKGTMPKAIVNFTTKATLNEGGKSAAWQYIGAPGAEVDMSLVATTVLYLRSEEQGWVRKWSPSAELVPFAGYALTQKEQESFVFKPRIVIGDQEITLTYTSSGMKGDNLWANSYMAPIDIKSLGDDDFVGKVDKTVYLYNSGSWTEWSENKDAISSAAVQPGRYYAIPVGSARALDAAYDQTVIPPMQGVYMKAGEGGGSLTLNYEKHVWNCASNEMNRPLRIAGKKIAEDDYLNSILRVRLQLNSQNSGADRMYLIQDSACTGGYDNGYDAPKQMMSGLMNIYTNEAHGKMEISATDQIDGMYLGFAAGEDEAYSMTFTSLIGEALYLYDLEQDTLVEMSDGGQYVFNASAHSTNDMRFQVLVNPELSDYLPSGGNNGVTTDVQPIQVQNLWVQDKVVYIANAPINSVLEVYTVGGVLITKYNLGYAPCTLTLSSMPTGVYMLRLNDKVYKFVCK